MSWSLSHIVYDNKSFSVTNEDYSPEAIAFSSDGSKMYMLGWGTDTVYQYTLSTPWDVSTATYDTISFSVRSQESLPVAMYFKPDGTKMYISGQHGIIYQYSLTAWDLSTVSYDNKNYDITGQNWNPYGIHFKPDGTKMYIIINSDAGEGVVYQYTLSTPWDVSTASYDSVSFPLSSNWWYDIQFNPDGTRMYAIDGSADKVLQYSLSATWDISSASYDNVSNQQHAPHSMDFKSDGTKIYMLGKATDTVYQYSLPVAEVTTEAASQISYKCAMGNGTIVSGENITERGFEVKVHVDYFGGAADIFWGMIGFHDEGEIVYHSYGQRTGYLIKRETWTGEFEVGIFEGVLGHEGIAYSIFGRPDSIFCDALTWGQHDGLPYIYRAYMVSDGITYHGEWVAFNTLCYPLGYADDDIVPITDIIPIEPPPIIPEGLEPWYTWWYFELPEFEFPEFEWPEFTYPEMPPYNGSWLGTFYYRKAYTKRDLDELRKKCRIFQDNSVEYALVVNHNSRVLQQFLNTLTKYKGANEYNTFRPIIPSQHLNELARKPLNVMDFRDMINNFIDNSIDNTNNVNNNFRLIRDGLSDYTHTEDEGFRDILVTTKIINDNNPDVESLKKVVDRLNGEMANNYAIINHNLHVLRSILI